MLPQLPPPLLDVQPRQLDTPPSDEFRHKVWFVIRTLVVVGLALTVFFQGFTIFLFAFAGVLLGIFLNSIARFLHASTGLAHSLVVSLLVVLLIGVIVFAGWLTAPWVGEQLDALVTQLPAAGRQVEDFFLQYRWGSWLVVRTPPVEEWLGSEQEVMRQAGGFLWLVSEALVSVVLCLFVAFYLALEPDLYREGMVKILAPEKREKGRAVLLKIAGTLERWMWGQLAAMALVGVATAIGLKLLGMPLPITLGVLAGLLAFIPNLGPVMFLLPAMLLAVPQGLGQVGAVFLLYLGIQVVESYMITPMIQKEMVHLPPAVTILSQVLMGVLFGFMGLLVAVPLVAVVMVLVKELHVKEQRRIFHGQETTQPNGA